MRFPLHADSYRSLVGRLLVCWAVLGLAGFLSAAPAAAQDLEIDVTRTSLDELANLSVTSASRREEDLWSTSAAIYVLTAEDLERAGVTNVPDALRLVPGAQVAHIDANKSAVSIRGFNSRSANKLLVLIDGRSIYDPLFSGVLWETKDLMLENIERIEVVRGPGGALWGANAVNGVINIITKPVAETPTRLLVAGVGTEEQAHIQGRASTSMGTDTYLRLHGRYANRDAGYLADGAFDESWVAQTGFQIEHRIDERNDLMLQAGAYRGEAGEPLGDAGQDVGNRGAHALGQWRWVAGLHADLTLKGYLTYTDIDNALFREERTTFDLDLTHHFRLPYWQDLVWGAGFRYTSDMIRDEPRIDAAPILPVEPNERQDALYSAFLQHQIAVLDRRLRFTTGVKLEHNNYSGFEVQPSVRAAFIPNYQQTLWAAVSRAVRTPSRLESDLFVSGRRLGELFDAEVLWAYEAGYRIRWESGLFVDVAAFVNDYSRLLTFEPATGLLENNLVATTYGLEVASKWQFSTRGRLEMTYTFLEVDSDLVNQSQDVDRISITEGSDPAHTATVRSSWNIGRFQFDAILRAVGELEALGVDRYVTADLRVGVQVARGVLLEVVGRNLFDARHFEQASAQATQIERSVFANLQWRF